MKHENYDFCGWVTKNDVKCSDGRIIRRDAFAHQDGMKVPMVYMHNHESPSAVLGYTILENRPEGVYGYSYCNDTEAGKNAREFVRHGDINGYSIYANRLREKASEVVHGFIREVSLVLNGANDGAKIEDVAFSHSEDGEFEYEVIYTSGDSEMKLYHADNEQKEEKKEESDSGTTVGDVLDTFTDEQKKVVAFLIGNAIQNAIGGSDDEDEDEDEVEHSDEEGEDEMKTNVFDQETISEGGVLSHSDIEQIFADAKRGKGTLKEMYEDAVSELYHDDEHGIEYSEDLQEYGVNDPAFLFPDARSLNNPPEWIMRDQDWVSVVMNGVHHTPFSRIKSQFADITEDEARAKGYIKGRKKKEEVFTLLKRITTPQTIYKLQKLDRDDIIDITDFDVVAWIKSEMRIMLNEEIARAILIGDGRSTADNDHISEDHIRPIWTDADLFVIHKTIDTSDPENIVDGAVRARKDYKGSGNPTLFTTEDYLTDMLLKKDNMGHRLYKSESELATAMRVSKIVTVPVMEGQSKNGKELVGIIVNLNDYNVGADKGGAISLFDDFDIDFNQYKYLIETRCSGALIKPYSAIVLEKTTSNSTPNAEEETPGEG